MYTRLIQRVNQALHSAEEGVSCGLLSLQLGIAEDTKARPLWMPNFSRGPDKGTLQSTTRRTKDCLFKPEHPRLGCAVIDTDDVGEPVLELRSMHVGDLHSKRRNFYHQTVCV